MNPFGTLLRVPMVLWNPANEGELVPIEWRETEKNNTFYKGNFRMDHVIRSTHDCVIQGYVCYDGIVFHKAIILINDLGNASIDIEEIWF